MFGSLTKLALSVIHKDCSSLSVKCNYGSLLRNRGRDKEQKIKNKSGYLTSSLEAPPFSLCIPLFKLSLLVLEPFTPVISILRPHCSASSCVCLHLWKPMFSHSLNLRPFQIQISTTAVLKVDMITTCRQRSGQGSTKIGCVLY